MISTQTNFSIGLVCLGFIEYKLLCVISCQIIFININEIYMICEHILLIIFLNEPKLIFSHTVKGFQVNLSNTDNSIYY